MAEWSNPMLPPPELTAIWETVISRGGPADGVEPVFHLPAQSFDQLYIIAIDGMDIERQVDRIEVDIVLEKISQ